MAKTKWKLTRDGKIDEWGDDRLRFSRQTASLLELFADDPKIDLIEIRPGVYVGPKAP